MTRTADDHQEWVSIHIFYHGDLDALIVHLAEPLIDELRSLGLARDGFFLRYWDGGPHLRLRIKAAHSAETVRSLAIERSRAYLDVHPSSVSMNPALYARDAAWLGSREGVQPLPMQPTDTILAVDYVPETSRYGSGGSLSAVEKHFGQSSRLAAGLIAAGATPAHRQTAVSVNILLAWALSGATQIADFAPPSVACLRSATAQLDHLAREPGRTTTDRAVPTDTRSMASVDHCRRLIPGIISLAEASRTTTSTNSFARWARSLAITLDEVAADPHRPERCDRIADLAAHLYANRLGVDIGAEGKLRAIAAQAVLSAELPVFVVHA